MKKIASLSILGVLLTTPMLLNQANAMTDQEADCSIWLCLPAGFPSGCSPALGKFKERLKKFKPPAPNFASCVMQPSNDIGIDFNAPEAPYEILKYNVLYINDGTGVKRTESTYSNMSKCPYNGEITSKKTYHSRGRIITETWLDAICTRTTEYGTNLKDFTTYRYIDGETGKPLKTTQGNFKPKLIHRSSMSDK